MLSAGLMLTSTITALGFFLNTWGNPFSEYSITWFSVGGQVVEFSISIHATTLLLFMLVTFISFLVHLYSIGYMVDDGGERRYFAMLGFFTFSMLGLVMSGNLLQLFFFWELVSISSYFLIGHWREKEKAASAATKAFVMNRIGDAGFLIGLALLWTQTHTLSIAELATFSSDSVESLGAIGFCIFLGVMGKSAQFPLLTWLPDAMEGPTPVSALIHAATMVAAGVFLLVRVHFLFTSEVLAVIAVTGAITSIFGAWHALRQFDIKKILAYSTLSQLGLMVMAFGAGAWAESLLHLYTHAFFKACLFLCAGAIIHSLHLAKPGNFDAQDIRNMGGLRKLMPNVFIAFLLAASALAGIPLFSGFISKEAMLGAIFESAISSQSILAWMLTVVFLVVSFLTVAYTVRLVLSVFFGKFRAASEIAEVPRTPSVMVLPIAILSLFSVWLVASFNPFHPDSWILRELNVDQASPTVWITILSLAGIITTLIYSYSRFKHGLGTESSNPAWLDKVYQRLLMKPLVSFSKRTERGDRKWIDATLHGLVYAQVGFAFIITWFDRYIVDGAVGFTAKTARGSGYIFRSMATGTIQGYLLWAVMSLVIFLFWMLK
jgi:NADH-quinone oxidoreductase subunit L